MQDPVENTELLAFTKTVEAKSLTRAAVELGVPRATISRRLARLEERLGARLLKRTTRSLVLTDAGDALYRHARIVLDAVARAEACVRQTDDAIRGDLRVSVPPIGEASFFAMTTEFARRHPEVRLHVHFSSHFVDLRRDGYDVALRAASGDLEPGLVARTLSRSKLLAVASQAYLAQNGVPRSRRDLAKHRCVMGFARGEVPQTHWPWLGGKIQVEGVFFSNDPTLLCDAALGGLGIAFLPLMIAQPHLESGALTQVLGGLVEASTRVVIVYPEREFVSPAVRAFVDTMAAWGHGRFGSTTPETRAPAHKKRVRRRSSSPRK